MYLISAILLRLLFRLIIIQIIYAVSVGYIKYYITISYNKKFNSTSATWLSFNAIIIQSYINDVKNYINVAQRLWTWQENGVAVDGAYYKLHSNHSWLSDAVVLCAAEWRAAERLDGNAVGSIPTVNVCQSTAIFQHYGCGEIHYILSMYGLRSLVGIWFY